MRVESARYALLRRLASALRHNLVMHLQPIGMVTEVMDRRLRAPAPDLAQVNETARKINALSKTAVNACLDVVSWLSPDPSATVSTDAAIAETLELLRSNFSFRGFSLKAEAGTVPQSIGRSAVRMLLPGALLALSDTTPAPAEITLGATAEGEFVHLRIHVNALDTPAPDPADPTYRRLRWEEIEALAGAEDVVLRRTDTDVTLEFVILD